MPRDKSIIIILHRDLFRSPRPMTKAWNISLSNQINRLCQVSMSGLPRFFPARLTQISKACPNADACRRWRLHQFTQISLLILSQSASRIKTLGPAQRRHNQGLFPCRQPDEGARPRRETRGSTEVGHQTRGLACRMLCN